MKKRPKEILNKAQEIIDEKFDELSYTVNGLREKKYGFGLRKEKGKLCQKNYE